MTAPDTSGEALTAALIQISGHAERIAGLDTREANHYQEIAARIREIASPAAAATARADGTHADQSALIASLDSLDRQVAALAARLTALAAADTNEADDTASGHYHAGPAPRWWKLTGPEREEALDRLRAWVDRIYQPCYGQLAAILPACWEDHPLCLNTLDWLSKLWSLLYLTADRSDGILAAQAEWQTRLLPAAADQMAAESSGCQHRPAQRRGTTRRTSDQRGNWTA